MGLAGFGVALVALAFLPYIMAPADAIVLITLYAAVFALAIFVPVRRDFTPARVADLILGTIAGTANTAVRRQTSRVSSPAHQ